MDIADFVIHVQPELSAAERGQLEEELGRQEGVLSVHFSAGHTHLLTIAYNPDVIRSGALLALVGARGVAATKLGL
jgi:hypothetical protein